VKSSGWDRAKDFGAGKDLPPNLAEKTVQELILGQYLAEESRENGAGYRADYVFIGKNADALMNPHCNPIKIKLRAKGGKASHAKTLCLPVGGGANMNEAARTIQQHSKGSGTLSSSSSSNPPPLQVRTTGNHHINQQVICDLAEDDGDEEDYDGVIAATKSSAKKKPKKDASSKTPTTASKRKTASSTTTGGKSTTKKKRTSSKKKQQEVEYADFRLSDDGDSSEEGEEEEDNRSSVALKRNKLDTVPTYATSPSHVQKPRHVIGFEDSDNDDSDEDNDLQLSSQSRRNSAPSSVRKSGHFSVFAPSPPKAVAQSSSSSSSSLINVRRRLASRKLEQSLSTHLQAWVEKYSTETGCANYHIAGEKDIAEIVIYVPTTKENLKALGTGWGLTKLKRHGDALIAAITDWIDTNNVELVGEFHKPSSSSSSSTSVIDPIMMHGPPSTAKSASKAAFESDEEQQHAGVDDDVDVGNHSDFDDNPW
jgi:hypothetical protein